MQNQVGAEETQRVVQEAVLEVGVVLMTSLEEVSKAVQNVVFQVEVLVVDGVLKTNPEEGSLAEILTVSAEIKLLLR